MATPPGHKHAERFDFREDRHTAVYCCERVKKGAPVLYVSHDDDGDWQFLCGGPHGDGGSDEGVVFCLECVVADDPSLNDVADMCGGWSAERSRVGEAWNRQDGTEDVIRDAVAEHGWFVLKIPASESEDEPAFAYTIGLYETFGHPELICVGLRLDVMHSMLNICGDLIKNGKKPPVGTAFGGVVDGYAVRLREVRAHRSYDEHLGYAIWFHGGRSFPVLQLVWPDKDGRFPGEAGADPVVARRQPFLP